MRLKDVKISKQLNLGLGIIILLVVGLGYMAWYNSEKVWQNTKGLYEHPFTVQKAIAELRADVLHIRVEMKELVLSGDTNLIPERVSTIDLLEADLYRKLDTLYGAYLGPRSDLDAVFNGAVEWRSVRDETIRLVKAGEWEKATARTRFEGEGGIQSEQVLMAVERVNAFSTDKASQFYAEAEQHKDQNVHTLAFAFTIILLLTGSVSIMLRRGILTPLTELTVATDSFRRGRFDARCDYESLNEFGDLSNIFNQMADTVEREIQNKESISDISAAMTRENELHRFSQELLKSLLTHTGSQIGAIYLLNDTKTDYIHFESTGLKAEARKAFAASEQEGEFGSVLAERKIQHIRNIPSDTRFVFSAVSGNIQPKEILTIPVISGSEIIAVISLASIQAYSDAALRFLNDIWSEMNARFNGVLTFQKVNDFSYKLQHTNTELEVQTKELVMQADELAQQNMELEMQKKLLDEASQLKSSFLSNMSHELRTPLNSVIALTAVLNRRLRGTIAEEEYSYLDVIERNGKNLLALVNDILDLSRIEAGKEQVTISCFSMKELVDEIVETVSPQVLGKDIRLINNVPAELPTINSDLSMCRHILQNIIGNAVKFIREGTVDIIAQVTDGHFYVSVADTGIGIAEDQIHYIFDEFRQVDESTSRKYGGTGLGLAIAKKYAMLLQGDITVKSTVGEGSTFTVRLPQTIGAATGSSLLSAKPHGADSRHFGALHTASGHGKSILLVEDSEPAIIQMKDILTEQGYQVRIARSGKEALDSISEVLPDAMILDLMMPEVDGFEVLKAVRSVEATAFIPVLILTAKHVTKEELSFLTGNHVFQLIQKGSIGKAELLGAVRNMVRHEDTEIQSSVNEPSTLYGISERPLILVVEDNIDNRTTVKALLQETCHIIEAEDGLSGIEQARNHCPAMILLDISLPVMDGFQVLQSLREDDILKNIPVVALTARAMKGDREEILAYGFDDYISKPFDEKLLEETIRRILDAGQKN